MSDPEQPVGVAYSQQTYGDPAPLYEWRSLGGLATALTALLSIIVVVQLVSAGALFVLAAIDSGSATFDSLNTAVVALGGVFHVLLAGTAVVFVVWQYRHASNAQALGARGALGPGWAIGGWFIPLANFVLPAMQVFQSSRGSHPKRASFGDPEPRGAAIVLPWAMLFGLGATSYWFYLQTGAGSGSVGVSAFARQTLDGFWSGRVTAVVNGVGSVLLVLAAVVCIVMVRSLSRRQADAIDQQTVR